MTDIKFQNYKATAILNLQKITNISSKFQLDQIFYELITTINRIFEIQNERIIIKANESVISSAVQEQEAGLGLLPPASFVNECSGSLSSKTSISEEEEENKQTKSQEAVEPQIPRRPSYDTTVSVVDGSSNSCSDRVVESPTKVYEEDQENDLKSEVSLNLGELNLDTVEKQKSIKISNGSEASSTKSGISKISKITKITSISKNETEKETKKEEETDKEGSQSQTNDHKSDKSSLLQPELEDIDFSDMINTELYTSKTTTFSQTAFNTIHQNKNALALLKFHEVPDKAQLCLIESYTPEMSFWHVDGESFDLFNQQYSCNSRRTKWMKFYDIFSATKEKQRQKSANYLKISLEEYNYKREEAKRKLFKPYKDEKEFFNSIQIGGIIAARFTEKLTKDDFEPDKHFYRAIVIDKFSGQPKKSSEKRRTNSLSRINSKPMLTVWFIDYGNYQEVEDLRDILPVARQFLTFPAMAVPIGFSRIRSNVTFVETTGTTLWEWELTENRFFKRDFLKIFSWPPSGENFKLPEIFFLFLRDFKN